VEFGHGIILQTIPSQKLKAAVAIWSQAIRSTQKKGSKPRQLAASSNRSRETGIEYERPIELG